MFRLDGEFICVTPYCSLNLVFRESLEDTLCALPPRLPRHIEMMMVVVVVVVVVVVAAAAAAAVVMMGR